MIGGALIQHLRTVAGVSALVAARAWFELAPSAPALPYIVGHHVFTERPTHMGGDTGMIAARGRYQFNCYASTAASAATVAASVRDVFHTIIDANTAGATVVYIESSRVITDLAAYVDPQSDQNTGIFNHVIDVEVWYRE